MPRAHTPEELAEAKRVLAEAKPLLDQIKQDQQAENQQWNLEISLLERRISEQFDMVELPGGGEIAIRKCPSEEEETKLKKLLTAWGKGNAEAAYKIIELVTANPMITADWLKKNPDKFSVADAMEIMFQTFEKRAQAQRERLERIRRLQSFREEPAGPESG